MQGSADLQNGSPSAVDRREAADLPICPLRTPADCTSADCGLEGQIRAGLHDQRLGHPVDIPRPERQKQILLDVYASFAQQNESSHEECPTETDSHE